MAQLKFAYISPLLLVRIIRLISVSTTAVGIPFCVKKRIILLQGHLRDWNENLSKTASSIFFALTCTES